MLSLLTRRAAWLVAASVLLLVPFLAGRAADATVVVTEPVTGNATWFTGLGSPYGGCGLPQANLDSQNFVALNVFNTPGDYGPYPRPIPDSMSDIIGAFDNGLNCGRYVQVTIGDNCTGINDGAPNEPFCRNGDWVSDQYNGATLTMIVADSCGDANAWCRDDPYHLDLAQASLNTFELDGAPVGDMYPDHWNNRHISWQFVPAPNYTGDINIGFIQGAQPFWGAVAISHLPNGIHGVDYLADGAWHSGEMDSDQGDDYIVSPTTAGGTDFTIRVHDADDQLINDGRTYSFSLPAGCTTGCSAPYTQVSYTTSDGSGSDSTPPTAPTGLTVTGTTAGSVSLSWSPATDDVGVTGYDVYRDGSLVGSTTSTSYTDTGLSAGTGYTYTVRARDAAGNRSAASAAVTAATAESGGGGSGCTAAYHVDNDWGSGFTATVTVTNTGDTATAGWHVGWTWPGSQQVTNSWNATVGQSGQSVSATNATYNATIAPAASTTFGFQATGSGTTVPALTCTAD